MTETNQTVNYGSSLQTKETVRLEDIRSGKKVILGSGQEAIVIKKAKNKGVFKDIYPYTVTMGTTTGELIRKSVKANGVEFKTSNGSLSDYSIAKVL